MSNFLLNLAATLILVVPGYLIVRVLFERVESNRAIAASATAALSEKINEVQDRVNRKLEEFEVEVDARVSERLATDRAAFGALATHEPTRESVASALERAEARGIVTSSEGIRVSLVENGTMSLRIGFRRGWSSDEEPLFEFRVENAGGDLVKDFDWPEGEPFANMAVRIREVMRSLSREGVTGEYWLRRLSEALLFGLDNPLCTPFIQCGPPAWVVRNDGLAAVRNGEPELLLGEDALQYRDFMEEWRPPAWVDDDEIWKGVDAARQVLGRRSPFSREMI